MSKHQGHLQQHIKLWNTLRLLYMLIEYVGLQLPKYIKHAFYKMQIHHHHRHALLHKNALQQTCNNEGWGLFHKLFCLSCSYSSLWLRRSQEETRGSLTNLVLNQDRLTYELQYGTWTKTFSWDIINLLFCSDKQITHITFSRYIEKAISTLMSYKFSLASMLTIWGLGF